MATPTTTSSIENSEIVAVDSLATTETETHAVDESVLGKLGINTVGFVGQLVNFLIVLAILKIWVFPKITKMLDERRETIEKGLKDAEEAKVRLSKLEDERADVIKQAKAEAAKVLETARADAEEQKKELIEKAKREVERVVINGKAQLKSEQETMLREARKGMIDIAVTAARRILEEGVDEKKAKSLAEEVVRKMT